MAERIFKKKILLASLKKAGLPFTMPNFINKYERLICDRSGCPFNGKPYLDSPRDHNDTRIYTAKQIRKIIQTAKSGWFDRHWHWVIGS